MTERKGLIPIVRREDFEKVRRAFASDSGSLNSLLDRIQKENPLFASYICSMALSSRDMQHVLKTSLYVYAFIECAEKAEYAFSLPQYAKMPEVCKRCIEAVSKESAYGIGIEMIERMREDNPLIAAFIDSALMQGMDAEQTLETAAVAYRLIELASENRLRSISGTAN